MKQDKNNMDQFCDEFAEKIQNTIIFLGKLLFMLLQFFGVLIAKKFFKYNSKDPIKPRHVKSKKQTKDQNSIGWQVQASRPLKSDEYNSRLHTMIMGPSGYGKTNLMTVLQQNALKKGHSVVYFDPKASRESRAMFTEICERQGRKVYYFDDVIKNGSSFALLREGNISQICDRIMDACTWSEPYYKQRSEKILRDVLGYLKSQGEAITMANIVKHLQDTPHMKDIGGLVCQLSSANHSVFSPLINDESDFSLSFRKIREENACLYIGLSALGYFGTADFLNKLFMGNLLFHCYEALGTEHRISGTLANKPMSIFFDELSSIVTPKFIDLQNKCRAAGVEICYATQCPSDLTIVSDAFRDQIMENTENHFLFRHVVPAHIDYISKFAGTTTVKKETYMTEDGVRSSKGSVRDVEALKVHPNIYRSLEVGQCVYINKRIKVADVLNIREHKRDFQLQQ